MSKGLGLRKCTIRRLIRRQKDRAFAGRLRFVLRRQKDRAFAGRLRFVLPLMKADIWERLWESVMQRTAAEEAAATPPADREASEGVGEEFSPGTSDA